MFAHLITAAVAAGARNNSSKFRFDYFYLLNSPVSILSFIIWAGGWRIWIRNLSFPFRFSFSIHSATHGVAHSLSVRLVSSHARALCTFRKIDVRNYVNRHSYVRLTVNLRSCNAQVQHFKRLVICDRFNYSTLLSCRFHFTADCSAIFVPINGWTKINSEKYDAKPNNWCFQLWSFHISIQIDTIDQHVFSVHYTNAVSSACTYIRSHSSMLALVRRFSFAKQCIGQPKWP